LRLSQKLLIHQIKEYSMAENSRHSSSTMFGRREFIKTSSALVAMAAIESRFRWAMAADERLPNIIFILCDDMGYGDIGCFGSKIPTPNIDSIAKEGVRFTHYSAAPVCSPSRAGLMTGRYQSRVGVPGVLFSNSKGLDLSEKTIANVLKDRGYATMCVGKWHLGDIEGYLPTSRGFDEYYGIPYSNDIQPVKLMHNTETIEYPVTQATLTKRYTEQAMKFIERSKDKPFFLYLPHNMPHAPVAASEDFLNKSGMGTYADAIMEIDWGVGQILNALKKYGLDKNTLVIFTSDNGPAGSGSSGGLRGGKGTTYEGGVRDPFVARFPGKIPAGSVCNSIAATIDMLPTLVNLTGAKLPSKPLDGVNIWPLFTGKQQQVEREVLLYWQGYNLSAARLGKWKVFFGKATMGAPGEGGRGNMAMGGQENNAAGGRVNTPVGGNPQGAGAGQSVNTPGGGQTLRMTEDSDPRPALYNLEEDPAESKNVAKDHPEVVTEITARVERLVPGFPEAVQTAWASIKSKWTTSGSTQAK
jgi:arylsulfatase A